MRVAVLVARLAQQPALLAQQLGERLVGVEDLQALDLGHGGQETSAVVDGDDDGDARGLADLLVFFTVGGGLVNDAGAVGGRYVIGHEDLPGVLGSPLLGVGVVVPEPVVDDALELTARDGAGHGGLGRCSVVVAELLRVVAHELGGEEILGAEHGGARGRSG